MKRQLPNQFRILLLALILLSTGMMQVVGQIPMFYKGSPNNSTWNVPWGSGNAAGWRVQELFCPGDLGPGNLPSDYMITKVYWKAGQSGAFTAMVNMKMTQVDPSIITMTGNAVTAGLVQVVNSQQSYTCTAAGWWGFDLETPYPFDPSQGIVYDMWAVTTTGPGSTYLSTSVGPKIAYFSVPANNTGGSPQTLWIDWGIDIAPKPATGPQVPPLANFKINRVEEKLWEKSPGIVVNTSTYSDFNYWNITGYSATSEFGPWTAYVPDVAVMYDATLNDTYLMDTVKNKTNLYYTFQNKGWYKVKLTTRNKYGISYIEKPIYVDVPTEKPSALFYTSRSLVGITDKSQFYDLSENGPTSWNWWLDPPCWTCGLQKNTFYSGATKDNTVSSPYMAAVDAGVYTVCLAVSNAIGSDTLCVPSSLKVIAGYEMCTNGTDTVGKDDEGFVFPINADNAVSYTATSCAQGFRIAPCADSIKISLDRLRLRPQDSVYIMTTLLPGGKILRRFGGNGTPSPANNFKGVKDSLKTLTFAGSQLFVKFVPGVPSGPNITVDDSGYAFRWSSVSATYPAPKASFSSPDTLYSGYKVKFQNTSTGLNQNYAWDMNGDGNYGKDNPNVVDSFVASPSQTYITDVPMQKKVCLKTFNCRGSDTACKTFWVLPTQIAPFTDFMVNRTDGFTNDTFMFTDLSINGPKTWRWRFEPTNVGFFAGTDSTSQNPVVFLNAATTYDVTLLTTNEFGSSLLKKTAFVSAKTYPSSGSKFSPTSTGEDFGIGRVRLVGSIGKIDTLTPMKPLDGSAYLSLYKQQKTTLFRGAKYTVEVFRTTAIDSQNTRVWIDFDRDASYLTANELILIEDLKANIKTSREFTVPSDASIGTSRMLVGASAGFSLPISPVSTTLGTYRDYGIIIGVDNVKPVLTLKGSDTYKTELNKPFTDPGAEATDNIEGDISGRIKVVGTIDLAHIGYYELKYYVNDYYNNVSDTVTRIIQVEVNQTGPTLTLTGGDTIYLNVNEDGFIEPGYMAKDNQGTDITSGVVVSKNIDTTVLGNYQVEYLVSDAFGFNVSKTRVVIVRDIRIPQIMSRLGSDTIRHQIGTAFEDNAYVKVDDNYWTNVAAKRTGDLNPESPGIYQLTYNAVDGSGNKADAKILYINVTNLIPPTVQLNGSPDVIVDVYTAYIDPLATGKDYKGEIITKVEVTSVPPLNTNVTGEYNMTYTVTDNYGNKASTQRLIRVKDREAPVITILGDNPITTTYGKYKDADHYKILDNYDMGLPVTSNSGQVLKNEPGNYTVYFSAVDKSGNKAQRKELYVTIISSVGIAQDPSSANGIDVYPNPSKGVFNIDLKNVDQVSSIRIYNIAGSLVKEILNTDGMKQGFRIDLSNEKDGMYFVKIEGANKSYTTKINIAK